MICRLALDSKGFYGVGSGSSYAIGALAQGATVEEALKIASKYDAYTSAPFMFVEQLKKKVAAFRKSSILTPVVYPYNKRGNYERSNKN
jgi:hypothetical protein